jgi:hypothetical protein
MEIKLKYKIDGKLIIELWADSVQPDCIKAIMQSQQELLEKECKQILKEKENIFINLQTTIQQEVTREFKIKKNIDRKGLKELSHFSNMLKRIDNWFFYKTIEDNLTKTGENNELSELEIFI